MFHALYLAFLRFNFWFGFSIQFYKFWSNLYRFIWERDLRDITLRPYTDLRELYAVLSKNAAAWRADSWKEGYDAVSHPAKAQEVFDGNRMPFSGFDCDDYAIYITCVLEKSLALGPIGVALPRFFTVTWLTGWSVGGHNVCLVRLPDDQYAYLDYGDLAGHASTPEGVALNVFKHYAPDTAKMIGWAISTSDLTAIEVNKG